MGLFCCDDNFLQLFGQPSNTTARLDTTRSQQKVLWKKKAKKHWKRREKTGKSNSPKKMTNNSPQKSRTHWKTMGLPWVLPGKTHGFDRGKLFTPSKECGWCLHRRSVATGDDVKVRNL